MIFEVTILGCGSATPTMRHQPTAQILNHDAHYFLFDCGEGTQLQLRRYSINFQRINHIFISHLHGDHCLGLPGLISTMHLLGRTNALHVYAHEKLKDAVALQLRISHSRLRFDLVWHDLAGDEEQVIMENSKISVFSFPLFHGVPCCGFRMEEKPKQRNIIPELIAKYSIPIPRIRQIKDGADYRLEDGSIISNAELTREPEKTKSYAFCTDTAYAESTAGFVRNVDLLYHESTFLERERQRATTTHHSTAMDAARVANEAGAKQLLLGHFSARYRNTDSFLTEAKTIFDNVTLADEGMKIDVG